MAEFCQDLLINSLVYNSYSIYPIYEVMARTIIILLLFYQFTQLCMLPAEDCLISFFSDKDDPVWWEIKLVLSSKGNYKADEGQSSYPGNYSFTIIWTGTMERDDEDFLIYHENSKLIQWEAQETAIFPDSMAMLSTNDFSDKPFFKMNYILKRGEILYFDFSVQGFYIPQNKSEQKFYLNLPVSEENSQRLLKKDYDPFVFNGSNSISMEEKEIYLTSVEKIFAWKWKYRRWSMDQKKYVYFSHLHEVKVEISIMPHFKRRQKNSLRKAFAMLGEIPTS